ncbi:heparinase II/III domain-containing protein [Flavobacterium rhizosphaerae]|uniref:Heparinase II/III family protein n=1 Tax=Flavobacterium rhizosphaerae TaxID=3163298 RepID=A0ABW8Z1V1_9FLAO
MKIKSLFFFLILTTVFYAQQQPVLLLSDSDIENIKRHLDDVTLLDNSFQELKQTADYALTNPIDVPLPVDNGGGYTHAKHKQNYRDMYAAAVLWRLTDNVAYSKFVEEMLLKYAAMYPKLPIHPYAPKNQFAGKLFWQSLNDYVWVVHSIQAYDLVKENIAPKNRKAIERDVFRSMAKFISESEGGLKMFNMIHNHGTWALAAVGMTGYVLHDNDMVERALYGSAKDKKTGFLKQLDALFSPDGYYSEGAYYERYALQPFMLFAQAIENNQPELRIFQYRNGLLGKAVTTMFQMTDDVGRIIPFNDALKEKDITSEELIAAADIAYKNYKDNTLLPIIKKQGVVTLTSAGFAAAMAAENYNKPYDRVSKIISDGPNGTSGGLALMRDSVNKVSLIFKYSSQGMNHGHFDRLGIQLYHKGHEILPDYGAVRFINIEAKGGGKYIKENETYAHQSIAHSTLIIDETSHYNGDWHKGEEHSPEQIFADIDKDNIEIISARDTAAYTGVRMQRTVALIKGENPFIIDIFDVKADTPHQYDLNYRYNGQVMETNFKYNYQTDLKPLGSTFGYEYLWKVAEGKVADSFSQLTWLNNETFYTINTLTDSNSELIFTKVGANDTEFNLRNEDGFLLREKNATDKTFVSIIEPHGSFDAVPELVENSHSAVKTLKLLYHDKDYTIVSVSFSYGKTYTLAFANSKQAGSSQHRVNIAGDTITWKGNYTFIEK